MAYTEQILNQRVYRHLARYAVEGYKNRYGLPEDEALEERLVKNIDRMITIEELAFLFAAGYLMTRPFKLAYRVGKFVARRG